MALIQCPECGKEVSDQAEYCIFCGYNIKKAKKQAGKKQSSASTEKVVRKVLPIVVIVALIVGVWQIFLPDLFMSTDALLERGDYLSAYNKAGSEERKAEIMMENQIAVVCQHVVSSLKDPSSFSLLEAGCMKDYEILLSVSANNSYGSPVTNYWVYDYEENGAYEYDMSTSDFEEETIYSFDSAEEYLNKLTINDKKAHIQLRLALGEYDFLSEEAVERINNLFAKDKLDDVKLIPYTDPVETEAPEEETEEEEEATTEEATEEATEEEATVETPEEAVEETTEEAATEEVVETTYGGSLPET